MEWGSSAKRGLFCVRIRKITYPESHKYYDHKIYKLGVNGKWLTAFTFAGSPLLMKQFHQRFSAAMNGAGDPQTVESIADVVEQVLLGMPTLDTDPGGLHMLGGIVIPKAESCLLRTEFKTVTRVDKHDYIGIGDSSLLRYLIPLLTRRSSYDARQAEYIGVYLTLQAKRFVDGCGGDTDIYTLKHEGYGVLGDAHRMEQRLLMLEHQLGQAASGFFDPRTSDEEFAETATRLAEFLTNDHFQIGIKVN